MRLTLRTLLAYLDDTLEPSEAKLIGQKVAESDAAQELIARIKQVTRRRRLTSSAATGPGVKLDPNLIAEYLDNVLTPDQLAEVEETCLASDTHLAEVAAAHQILTLVLGEPALVPPTARQRMYGLTGGREAIPNRKASTASVGQGAIESAHAGADDADDTLLLGLSLSRPGSWARWLLPVVAACLLLAAGLAIWMAVSPGIRPLVPSNKMLVDNSAALVLANPNQTVNSAEQTDKSKTEPPVVSDKKNEQQKNEGTATQKTEGESKTTKTTSKSEETASKTAAETKPAPKPPPAVLPPRAERHDVARMTIMPNWPSVLLQQTTDRPTWQRLRPESRVFTTDLLMSLPGYRSQLLTDNGVQLLLRGNLPQLAPLPVLESAIVLYQNADVDVDFKLDRGLVLLSNQKATGPAHVRVRFHKEVWDVTLPDRGTEVGVELSGACRPYSKEPGGTEPGSRLTVYALKGKPALQIRYREIPLPVPSLFIWDSNYGTAPGPKPLEGVPDWAVNKVAPQNKDVQGIESALKSLASRLIAKDATDVVLGEALHDEDPAGRVVAVHCLGAVGDWSNLIDALGADDRRWDLRILAIHELRFLLGQDAKNDQKLFSALKQKNYKDPQAQTVLELLHGYSEDDWTNPGTRAAVVDYLMSDKLAIRQLTHFLLASLIPEGRKIPYDPAGDSDQRERGYTEWRKVVLGVKPGGGKAKGS